MEAKSILLTGLKNAIRMLGCCIAFLLSFNTSVHAQKNLYSSPLSAKENASNKKKESIVGTSNTTDSKTEGNMTSGENHSLYQTGTSSSLYQPSSNDNFYMEPASQDKNSGGSLYAPPPEGGNPTGGEAPVGNPSIYGFLTVMGAYALHILRRSKKA